MKTMSRMRSQSGFTLIEVMIVCAVIGILTSIILPNVQYYILRSKISEAILAFSSCRNTITELYATGDTKTAGNWGCEIQSGQATRYVDSVDTTGNGTIVVWIGGTGDLRLDTHRITMAPLDNNGAVMSGLGNIRAWRCGSAADGTDLNERFLPGSCRGI